MATKAITKRKFSISGNVTDKSVGKGAAGLRIQAWDKDVKYHDFLAAAVTDAKGAFKLSFDEKFFKDHKLDTLPDLYFKIYRDKELIADTRNSIIWNAKSRTKNVRIEIDTTQPQREYIVQGQVRQADGFPIAGARVHAFDKDLRIEQAVGINYNYAQEPMGSK